MKKKEKKSKHKFGGIIFTCLIRKLLDKANDTGCGLDQLLKHLTESILQILSSDELTCLWNLANVIPIPKPGSDYSE